MRDVIFLNFTMQSPADPRKNNDQASGSPISATIFSKLNLSGVFKERQYELMREQLEALNRLLASKDQDLEAKEAHLNLVDQLHQERQKGLQAIIHEKQVNIELSEQKLKDMEQQIYQFGSLRRDIMRLEDKALLYQNTIRTYETKISKMHDAMLITDGQLKVAEKRLAEREEELTFLKDRNQMLEEGNHTYTTQIETLLSDEFSLREQLDELKRQVHVPVEFDAKKLKDERDQLAYLVVQFSRTLLATGVSDLVGDHGLGPELRSELVEIEKRMSRQDQNQHNVEDKMNFLRNLISSRSKIIRHLEDQVQELQREGDAKEGKLNELESKKKKMKTPESEAIHESQLVSLQRQIDRISVDMEVKERQVADVLSTVRAAEIELEEKETEMLQLEDQVVKYRGKYRECDRAVRDLTKESDRLDKEITIREEMIRRHASVHNAKTEALHAKEELLIHFFELIQATDLQIQTRDGQVKKLQHQLSNKIS